MVYSEMPSTMPSNGFGSPISPPEVFQQVPSPSQYSDPSCSPRTMHSPSYSYCSDIDKIESMLKEEPRSPYNNFATTTNLMIAPIPSAPMPPPPQQCQPQGVVSMQEKRVQTIPNQQQFQQGRYLQQSSNSNVQPQQVHFIGGLPPPPQYPVQQQQQQMMSLGKDDDQLLVFTQNLDDFGPINTDKVLADFLSTYDVNSNVMKNISNMMTDGDYLGQIGEPSPPQYQPFQPQQQSQVGGVRHVGMSQQQTFFNNHNNMEQQLQASLQQQQNQLNLNLQQQMNAELSMAISLPQNQAGNQLTTNNNNGDGAQATPQAGGGLSHPNAVIPHGIEHQQFSTLMAANTTFEGLIDSSDIKTEHQVVDPLACTITDVKDNIRKDISHTAGISHCPREWSANDVRLWLKVAAKVCGIIIPEMTTNLNINGPTLLNMSSDEFTKLVGSKECDHLRELITVLDDTDNTANQTSQAAEVPEQTMQVKLETVQKQEPTKQVKQEVLSHQMLPASVVNHNQSQNVQLHQQSIPQLSQFKPGQSHFSVEMQASHQIPANNQEQLEQQKQNFRNYQQQVHQQQQGGGNVEHLVQQNLTSPNIPRQMASNVPQFNQAFGQMTTPLQQSVINNHHSTPIPNLTSRPMHSINPGSTILSPASSPVPIKPDSPIDSQMFLAQTILSSPKSNPAPLQEGANGYIDDPGTDLSILLQPTSHQHPATLDHQDESMETDEESEGSPPPPPTTTTSGTGGRTHIQLWQFLKELLNNNKKYGSCIRWVDRREAIFKIEDSVKVASLWGERKNRPQMNYDKLSRSIRQYYNKNIMKKTERSQRLVYQFCSPYGN